MSDSHQDGTTSILIKQIGSIWLIQMTLVIIPLIDTYLLSGISSTNVAGYALANAFYGLWILAAKGVLQGTSYAIAPRFGQNDNAGIASLLMQSGWLLVIMTVVAWGLLWFSSLGIRQLSISDDLKTLAVQYLYVITMGVPAVLGIRILVAYLQAIDMSDVVFKILWIALPFKILIGYGCVQGYFGNSWQGTTGTALSTNLYYWLVFVIVGYISYRRIRPYIHNTPITAFWAKWSEIRQLLGYGLPIGASYLAEYSLFPIIISLLAVANENMLAAHEIMSNIYDLFLSLPIALMIAMSIWLGQRYPSPSITTLKTIKYAEMILLGFAVVAGLVIYGTSSLWVGYYNIDTFSQELIFGALPLLILRGVFECTASLNAFYLRAIGHGWSAFIFTMIGLWGIGFFGISVSDNLTINQIWQWLALSYGLSWVLSRWWFWRVITR